MPWKNDAQGRLALENGAPVWIAPDGTERPQHPDAQAARLEELALQVRRYKGDLDSAAADLAALKAHFDGVEDIGAFAAKARADAASLSRLLTSGGDADQQLRLQEAVRLAVTPLQEKLRRTEARNAELQALLDQRILHDAFRQSRFLERRVRTPALAERLFSQDFCVRDGKIVAKDENGQDMRNENGELASLDEALAIKIRQCGFAGDLLRAGGGSGHRSTLPEARPGAVSRADADAIGRNLEAIARGEMIVM